jgi:hypothetical protein
MPQGNHQSSQERAADCRGSDAAWNRPPQYPGHDAGRSPRPNSGHRYARYVSQGFARRCQTGGAERPFRQDSHQRCHQHVQRSSHQSFTRCSTQGPTRNAARNVGLKPNNCSQWHSASRSTSHSAIHLQNHSASDSPTESPTELSSDSEIRPTSHSGTESPIHSGIQLPIQSLNHSTSNS